MNDDDEFGSLEVYTFCVTIGSLDVWKFGSLEGYTLHILCDDDTYGGLEV